MQTIPIWEKYVLSLDEASEYFHIGINRVRKIVNENPLEKFVLWNGNRAYIKRKLFEQYIDELGCL